MAFLGFTQGSLYAFLDSVSFWHYVVLMLWSMTMLYTFSIAGRPVAHPDKSLGKKHKEAQAERVEILERLKSGSKVDDVQLVNTNLSDVEKEPLCSLLLPNSNPKAKIATISVSSTCGMATPTQACKLMKKFSEEGVDDSFIISSDRRLLQSKVELHDGTLERLKGLVKEVSKPPKELAVILQVDNWAILQLSGSCGEDLGVNLLRLPIDEVPVILHAEYAAGLLTITGLNLDDAEIYISAETANYTVKLNVWRFLDGTKQTTMQRQPWKRFSITEEDIATTLVRLSSTDLKAVFVYAKKKVTLGGDGQSFDAVSKAVRVVDSFWTTVLRLWIPTIGVWIFTIYCVRALPRRNPFSLGPINSQSLKDALGLVVLLLLLSFFSMAPIRFVEFVKYHVETLMGSLGQGLLVFYYGFKSLKGPRLEILAKYCTPMFRPPPPRAPPPTPPPKPRSSPPPPMEGGPTEVASGKPVTDPDWEWPAFYEFEDKSGRVKLKRRYEEVTDEISPFRVVYVRKKELLRPDVIRIDLFSTSLIEIVQKLFPHNGDLQFLENPKIRGRDLFLARNKLKNYELIVGVLADPSPECSQVGADIAKDENKGELHLKHLIRFLDVEYSDISVRQRRMGEEKRVAWDMLWAFLTPGKKVVYTCDHSQEVLAALVSKESYVKTVKGEWLFSIELEVWDYDGRNYHKCRITRSIEKFDGERAFAALGVRPIEMEGVPELLDEGFLANGKRFHEITMKKSHRFMHYSGPMFEKKSVRGCLELVKENAEGRVMIDLASFAKMNPGYQMGSAKPPVACCCVSFDHVSGRRIRDQDLTEVLRSETTDDTDVSEETLIFAPAIVYGFSFTLKRWGSFAISGFSEISFDTSAFDGLVMEPESKQLVYDLVSQYIARPVDPSQALQRVDPITHKGEGCIFLCYGPPGTGKTLTAESLAENMHRPLWSLSVSELGTTPNDLEQTLFKVLDIAATWRAVLLLDEADVFLEKRTSSQNLTRNAMTGVFLRFLEYYRGVLFLNTNRIGTFDNAFRSRISMFLHYPELSIQHKEQVWTALLERAGVAGVTAEFISEMATEELNGREIRNVIHTAQIWAKSKGQTLRQDQVRYTKSLLVSSLKTLSDSIMTSKLREKP